MIALALVMMAVEVAETTPPPLVPDWTLAGITTSAVVALGIVATTLYRSERRARERAEAKLDEVLPVLVKAQEALVAVGDVMRDQQQQLALALARLGVRDRDG